MSDSSLNVRRLDGSKEKDCERALQVLLAAFRGDMQLAAVTGGRTALEPVYLRKQLEAGLAEGDVYVAGEGDKIDGVIIAYGPDQDAQQEVDTNWAATSDYIDRLTPEMQQWWYYHLRPKYAELTAIALGSPDVRRGSWYIRLIGVNPECQRRGLARRLLDVFKSKADVSTKRMCTEVHNDGLVKVFAKHGFKVKGTKNFGSYQGGFPLFSMVREPKQ